MKKEVIGIRASRSPMLPRQQSDTVSLISRLLKSFLHICPCCGLVYTVGDDSSQPGRICPRCKASVRHRLFCLRSAAGLIRNLKIQNVLHMAPWGEFYLTKFLHGAQVTTFDLHKKHAGEEVTTTGDIKKMPFKDGHFDTIINFHVLEHITKPILAIKEIRRILKVGGIAYLNVPLNGKDWETTTNKPSIAMHEGRSENNDVLSDAPRGIEDHVTQYSILGFASLLFEAGFALREKPGCFGRDWPEDVKFAVARHTIDGEQIIYDAIAIDGHSRSEKYIYSLKELKSAKCRPSPPIVNVMEKVAQTTFALHED